MRQFENLKMNASQAKASQFSNQLIFKFSNSNMDKR